MPYHRDKVTGQLKVYGASAIKRAIQAGKPDRAKGADKSIADKPHENSRAVQRRLRQMKGKPGDAD